MCAVSSTAEWFLGEALGIVGEYQLVQTPVERPSHRDEGWVWAGVCV